MSGFSTLQNGSATPAQPKQISSRLLNMKFMQRSAAYNSPKSASLPATPTGEPAPKRRRTGDFSLTVSDLNSPSVPSPTTSASGHGDRVASAGAFPSEVTGVSIKRGINNYTTAEEETQWTLDIRLPAANGTTNCAGGYQAGGNDDSNYEEEEDGDDDDNDEIWSSTAPHGRQTYGSFAKRKRKTTVDSNGVVKEGTTTAITSNKRVRPGDDDDDDDDDDEGNNDEDLSFVSDDDNDNELSSGEIDEDEQGNISFSSPMPGKVKNKNNKNNNNKKQQQQTFNFHSEKDLTRMDALDFHSAGFEHGFGRSRLGLAGNSGAGAGAAFKSPARGSQNGHHRQQQQQHHKSNKKQKKHARKTM